MLKNHREAQTKLVRKSEGGFCQAPKHFNVWSLRKLGESHTERLAVSLSHFLPNGGVGMSGSPSKRMYHIINGSMVVKTKTEEFTLNAGDIGCFAPDEEREIKIVGDDVCTIPVGIVKV